MAVSISFYLIAILPLITSFFIFRNAIPEFDLRSPACTSLTLFLGNKVSYPGNAIYANSLTSYFSVQGGSLQPSCIVTPESSSDVATAVKILAFWKKWSLHQCQFAIRSGGHTSAAGAANIHQGVVLDLKLLNQIVVNEGNTVTTIGTGARWGEVYTKLDAMELSVVGGRVFDVGVGGLMTGGGMSFFSPRFGWACDNVESYEVVLANGEIVNASKNENPILWAALKGGSNNFGIVTRFDLKTFKHGKMWGGFVLMPSELVPKSLDAFAEFAGSSNYDENAALIHSVGFSSYGLLLALSMDYTIEKEDPEVFRPWIEMEPKFHNTLRTTNLSDIALEMSTFNPCGRRHYWITTTFKNDRAFLHKIVHLFNSTLPTITDIPGLETSFTFQPIPAVLNSKSATKDGKLNLLGMDGSEGPLVLCLLTTVNSLEVDDDRIAKFSTDLFNKIDEEAKAAGLFHSFKYLNYARPSQEVLEGYGPDSMAQMHSASKMYDSDLLFQACVPGGFKLFKD